MRKRQRKKNRKKQADRWRTATRKWEWLPPQYQTLLDQVVGWSIRVRVPVQEGCEPRGIQVVSA